MSEWQDIKTAPDNTWILAASTEEGVCIVCKDEDGDFYTEFGAFYGDVPLEDLTHWQPLPEMPK